MSHPHDEPRGDRLSPSFRRAWRTRLRRFGSADEGEEAIEVLLVLLAIFLPVYESFRLLHEILSEFLAFQSSVVTSPFF